MKNKFTSFLLEVGCDEAGRGCLAGPVFAAAVILPKNYRNKELNDSKKLSEKKREKLRLQIEQDALYWSVECASVKEIEELNILNASILAMHRAVQGLKIKPEYILVDGNRFKDYKDIPHTCMIKGDSRFRNIAAASILAKTYRDQYMATLHEKYPFYNWLQNKGYPTKAHRENIKIHGACKEHRKTFRLLAE